MADYQGGRLGIGNQQLNRDAALTNLSAQKMSVLPNKNFTAFVPWQTPGAMAYDIASQSLWFTNRTKWVQIATGGGMSTFCLEISPQTINLGSLQAITNYQTQTALPFSHDTSSFWNLTTGVFHPTITVNVNINANVVWQGGVGITGLNAAYRTLGLQYTPSGGSPVVYNAIPAQPSLDNYLNTVSKLDQTLQMYPGDSLQVMAGFSFPPNSGAPFFSSLNISPSTASIGWVEGFINSP